jgi:hypothetical protein
VPCRPPEIPTSPDKLLVRLLDKGVGQGSKWRVIDEASRVRVPTRGKPVIIEVTSHPDVTILNWDSIDIELVDIPRQVTRKAAENESGAWMHVTKKNDITPSHSTHYYRVKLFLSRTNLKFVVHLKTDKGDILSAESVDFHSTNSGISRNRTSKVEESNGSASSNDQAEPDPDAGVATMPSLPFDSNRAIFHLNANLNVHGTFAARSCSYSAHFNFLPYRHLCSPNVQTFLLLIKTSKSKFRI